MPRKSIQAQAISIIATLQNNYAPTSDQESAKIFVRGWNKVRIIFHPAGQEQQHNYRELQPVAISLANTGNRSLMNATTFPSRHPF